MRAHRDPTSLATSLRRAFGLLVAMLVVVGAAGVLGLVATAQGRDREERVHLMRQANTDMLLAMTDAETGVRGYRLSRDRSFLDPYTLGRGAFPTASLTALSLADDPREKRLLEQQRAVAQLWFRVYGDPVSAMPPDEVWVSHELTLRNKRIFDQLREANGQLDRQLEAEGAQALAHEQWLRTDAVASSVVALVLALAVAVLAAGRTRRALVHPLEDVVDVLLRLTTGDGAARADASTGPDEVRAVARSVNVLADESDRLKAEQEEAARLRRLAADIGRSIRDHLRAEDSVAEAISRVGEVLGADRTWMRRLDDDGTASVELAWEGPGTRPMGPRTDDGRRRGEHLVREQYALGDPVVIPDLGVEGALHPSVHRVLVERAGATAAVMAPVGAGGEALGVLVVIGCTGPREWAESEVALVQSVAADLGRALVLARLYAQQQALVEQLQQLDRTRTDFLSAVSHELRTPLTSIAGYVELIRDGEAGELPDEAVPMLGVIARNARRLQGLIEDLLTLSRIESGAFRVSRAPVELAEVLVAAEAAIHPLAASGGLQLDVDPAPAGAVVSGDAGQLERVLLNLLSNAVKFTPAGGRVRVRTGAEDGWVVLEVEDTGIGVPRAEQAGLFSRFFRASNATERAIQGTGLGLTIVRSIVEHHEGELSIRSEEGVGTTVTVRLPLLGVGDGVPAQVAGGDAPVAAGLA